MSRTVYLHAGAMKTGTSAIQVALVRNREALRRCGIFYPHASTDEQAAQGRITSGNGRLLSHLWRTDAAPESITAELSALRRVLEENPNLNLLYSSEFIAKADPSRLENLRDFLSKSNCKLVFIYYVRHLLDAAVSLYLQAVQAGETSEFSSWIKEHRHRYRSVLQNLSRIVGKKDIVVKLYDDEKNDIVAGFLSIFGISNFVPLPKGSEGQINRSLTLDEANVLLHVNRALETTKNRETARRVAWQVSEHIIYNLQVQRSKVFITEEELKHFSAKNGSVLEYVNQFVDGSFALKMKSDALQLGARAAEPWDSRDTVFLSVINSLVDQIPGAPAEPKQASGNSGRNNSASELQEDSVGLLAGL